MAAPHHDGGVVPKPRRLWARTDVRYASYKRSADIEFFLELAARKVTMDSVERAGEVSCIKRNRCKTATLGSDSCLL